MPGHAATPLDGCNQGGLLTADKGAGTEEYDDIEPEDIVMLSGLLGLSEVQTNALYYLRRRLGRLRPEGTEVRCGQVHSQGLQDI